MLIIHCDNRFDCGQLLRTRRPSYTVTLEALYPLERIPEFYRNDAIHELIGLPHESVLLTDQTDATEIAKQIAAAGQDAVIIDHEALRPAFAAFWENDALGKAVAEAARNGACLWIGFQSAGYAPSWLATLLPGARPWRVAAADEAGAVSRAPEAAYHPLAAALSAGAPVNWFCGESWRALRSLATTEPFDTLPQASEHGSIAWLTLPENGWRILATRHGRPEQAALAEADCSNGRVVLDQTLALHGANIDATAARRFAAAMRRFLKPPQNSVQKDQAIPLGKGWFGLISATVPEHAPARRVEFSSVPFQVYGEENLLAFEDRTAELPVNQSAERLFLLGGLLTWPFASGSWFMDARDFTQNYFIGDRAGAIRLVYADGAEDVVPLIFGVTVFWQEKNFRDGAGWRPPFDDDAARALLLDNLLLQRAEGDGSRAWLLDIAPRTKPLAKLVFEREPGKIGMPLLAAATIAIPGSDGIPPRSAKTLDAATSFADPAPRLLPLQRRLYTFPDHYETAPLDAPTEFEGARIRFHGPRAADVLSCIYAANIDNLAHRLHPEHGMVSLNSGPSYGSYRGGNGTWRDRPLPPNWNPDGWSRDNGRAGVERMCLGMRQGCEREIALWDRHLYCGQPPHMERTVTDMRQTHEWARTSLKGNPIRVAPENDGHGLVMLYRAAWMRHHPEAVERLWVATRDYAEWVCFLADNPIAPNQPADTLYTVSECSGFGGWDVHSHALCRAGLAAMAQVARQHGQSALAVRWEGYVARLSCAMRRYLVTGMPPCWKSHPASDWQSGAEALTPLLSFPDWLGYDPAADGDPEENHISRLTFEALTSGGKWWLRQRMIGYDMALVTQAALLFDDERLGKLLDALCKGIYSAHGPDLWIVSEGANMHESERMWYRAGMGGNLVHLAETLKVVRLMAGVDDLSPGELKLMPRVPADWSGITVEGYSLAGGSGGKPSDVSYAFTRGDNTAAMTIEAPAGLRVSARLGPFNAGASLRAMVNGQPFQAKTVKIGGHVWLWLRNLPGGETRLEVTGS